MGRRGWRRYQCRAWLLGLGFCLVGHAGSVAEAGPLYVYTDAQGQAVLTDNLDQVPAAYRGRVRTMTGTDSPAASVPAPAPVVTDSKNLSSSGLIGKIISVVEAKVGSRQIKGFTSHQTTVVIVAGLCWMALLALIFLSANPAIRLLSKFLLVLVGVAAVYHLAIVETPSLEAAVGPPQQGSGQVGSGQAMDNMLGRMRSKTEQSYRAQDERTTRQLEPTEQPAP